MQWSCVARCWTRAHPNRSTVTTLTLTHSLPFSIITIPSLRTLTDKSIQPSTGLVHCGSVLVLLSPLLSPWRLRERVWRHLADLRLLHLVENPGLIEALLPVLETPATPSIQSPPPAAPPATHSSDVSSAVDGRDNGLQGKQQLTGDGQRRKGSTTNALVRNTPHTCWIL